MNEDNNKLLYCLELFNSSECRRVGKFYKGVCNEGDNRNFIIVNDKDNDIIIEAQGEYNAYSIMSFLINHDYKCFYYPHQNYENSFFTGKNAEAIKKCYRDIVEFTKSDQNYRRQENEEN